MTHVYYQRVRNDIEVRALVVYVLNVYGESLLYNEKFLKQLNKC